MDFASRVSVICFAASYGIGMSCEVLRVFWSERWIRWSATGFAIAGLVAQSLFLLARWVAVGHLPIATQFESLITVSWLVSLIYLYFLVRDRQLAAGIFLLPISLGLVLFAALLPQDSSKGSAEGRAILPTAHGIFLILGTVFVVIAFVAALMYLVKVHQLKSGMLLGSVRLPSLERLDRLNTVSVGVAWALLTVGILLGLLLRKLPLWDMKVLVTSVAWLFFTWFVHFRWEHRGRKVAIVTIVATGLVLISVLGDPIFGTAHQPIARAAR